MLVFAIIFGPLLALYNLYLPDNRVGLDLSYGAINLFVLIMAMGVAGVVSLVEEMSNLANAESAHAHMPRLTSRLTDPGTANVVRLTVKNHHVQVFLSDGRQETLLMRFSDAVREMESVEGLLTHRSHWVALRYVDGLVRMGGRDGLQLRNGDIVPVSRTYKPQLQKRGITEA